MITLADLYPVGMPPSMAFFAHSWAPQTGARVGPLQCITAAQRWQALSQPYPVFSLPVQECVMHHSTQTRPIFPVLDDVWGWAGNWPPGSDGLLCLDRAVRCLPSLYTRNGLECVTMAEATDWLLLFLGHDLLVPPRCMMTTGRKRNAPPAWVTLKEAVVQVGLGHGHDMTVAATPLPHRWLGLIVAAVVRTVVRYLLVRGIDAKGAEAGQRDFVDPDATGTWYVGWLHWEDWQTYGINRLKTALPDGSDLVLAEGGNVKVQDQLGTIILTIRSHDDNTAADTVPGKHLVAQFRYQMLQVPKKISLFRVANATAYAPNDLQMLGVHERVLDTQLVLATRPAEGPISSRLHMSAKRLLQHMFAQNRPYEFRDWYRGRFVAPDLGLSATYREGAGLPASGLQQGTQEWDLVRYATQNGGCYHIVYPNDAFERTLCVPRPPAGARVSTLHHAHAERCPVANLCYTYTVVANGTFDPTSLQPLQP